MITAQVEPFSDVIEEIKPMLPGHWRELALYQDRMPLDPQWGAYIEREAQGSLVVVTLREAGAVIGYFWGFIAPGMHYQSTLTCTMDIMYVHPDHRGKHAGNLLLNTIRAELKRRGVKMWWMGSKNHKPIEWLYEGFGLERAEAYFCAWLGDDDAGPAAPQG